MTVGQRIAQKRKEKGLSQEALGERLGVSRQAIYKWESDAALPEIEKLVNLSREFDEMHQVYQGVVSVVNYIRDDVDRELYSMTNRMEELSQRQTGLTAEHSAEVADGVYEMLADPVDWEH